MRAVPESIDCPQGKYSDRGPTCCSGGQTTNPKMYQAVVWRAVAVAVVVAESMGWSDCSNETRPACWGSKDSSKADLTSSQRGAWVRTKKRSYRASGEGSWIQRSNCQPWSAAAVVEDDYTRGCIGA